LSFRARSPAAASIFAARRTTRSTRSISIRRRRSHSPPSSSARSRAILDITTVENNKQILSLTSGGKVREFLLTKRVLFRVHDKDGNDWLPTAEVVVRRTYTYSDTEALAKAYEEQRLWTDMQDDAVQLIVRRLESARKPVA